MLKLNDLSKTEVFSPEKISMLSKTGDLATAGYGEILKIHCIIDSQETEFSYKSLGAAPSKTVESRDDDFEALKSAKRFLLLAEAAGVCLATAKLAFATEIVQTTLKLDVQLSPVDVRGLIEKSLPAPQRALQQKL